MDPTLAQLLSELFRLARENDALRAQLKEAQAALAPGTPAAGAKA